MAVSVPYYEFSEVLSVRDADRDTFRTLADLAGRRVAPSAAPSPTRSCCRRSASTASRRCRTTTTCTPTPIWCSAASTPSCSTTCSPIGARRRWPGSRRSRTASPPATTSSCSLPRTRRCATASTTSCETRCATGRSSASSASGRCGTTRSPQLYRQVLAGASIAPVVGPGFEDDGAHARSRWEIALAYVPALLRASAVTLVLSCLAMALAVALGVLIASGRVYGSAGLRARAHGVRRSDARNAAPAPALRPLLRHCRG